MNSIRKSALSWIVAGAAIAALVLTSLYLHFQGSGYTDAAFVEANIREVARERRYDLVEARKAGHQDKDIAAYLTMPDIARFENSWRKTLVAVGGTYSAFVLAVVAIVLFRESRQKSIDA